MIRPIDLQSAILAGATNPAAQRTDQAGRVEAQAAQAAFAAALEREEEAVAATTEVEGNRIGAKDEPGEHAGGHARRHATGASFGASFEEVVDEAAAGSEEPAHLIDFTA